MAKSKNTRVPLVQPASAPFNSPFAHLAGAAPGPAAHEPGPVAPPPAPATALDLASQKRLDLRHERKGHGGKTVTLVSGLVGTPEQLDELARQLRRGLGCGATVVEGKIVLQGDQREQAAAWLTRHGAPLVRAL